MDIGLTFIAVFIAALALGKVVGMGKNLAHIMNRALMANALFLIFTVSMWGWSILTSLRLLGLLLAYSLTYAAVPLLLSYIIGEAIEGEFFRRRIHVKHGSPLIFIAALVAGWVLGALTHLQPPAILIDYGLIPLAALAGLLTSVGVDLRSLSGYGRIGILSAVSSIAGSAAAGLLLSYILKVNINASLAISLGMGWYTFTGPMVAVRLGPMYGMLGFLANLFREQLTYITVPLVPGGPVALISMGGATSMDDTLPVYVTVLGSDYAAASIVSGVLLTIAVPIVVPMALNLPTIVL